MSVLHALASHYDRLLANGAAPDFGYSREAISFAIVLTPGGDVVDVADLRETSGKQPRPSRRTVPRAVTRAGRNFVSNFLWDKTAYALGAIRDPDTGSTVSCRNGEDEAFKRLHREILSQTDDEGLLAIRAFLAGWRAERYDALPCAADMLGKNVVFSLDGPRGLIHKRPAARRIWQRYLARQGDDERLCLVTGEVAPSKPTHPKIKGVRDAQSSGASIVSFNQDAFCSHGKKQGANAPVSEKAAFAYTTALNTLLARDSRRRITIGDATTVFWADASGGEDAAKKAEDLFAMLADPPSADEEEAKIADKLEAISSGRPLADAVVGVNERTRFHVLGLSPNAARVSVRYWYTDRIGTLARRIVDHWRDLRIEPLPWKTPPSAWRLLIETAPQRKSDNSPPILAGAVMRAILTGSAYPRSLLATVVMRMRQDHEINGMRAAICKACIAREFRLGRIMEDVPVSLNTNETNVAYRLGRLFAVYESIQLAALGNVNATIKDRYFGAASATPATVFPLLVRTSGHHLTSLRKNEKPGLAHWFEREIDDIIGGVDTALPRSLRLEEQGRFAIGYHHQRASARRGSADKLPDNPTDNEERD